MAFHDRLKQAREKAELTQAQVASILGIAKSTYSGYETGKSEPSMNNIANLMRILEVSPEFLWQDEMEEQFRNEHPERFIQRPGMSAQSADEEELLSNYRLLIASAKEVVLTTVRAFTNNPDMRKERQNASAM